MIEVPIEMEVSTSYQPRTSGVSDYSELTNKPSINGTELVGDKSLSSLGIQETLISGTNIKTINGKNILGEGNIQISGGSGLSDDIKTSLLACFQHVAWIDSHGQDYYNALYEALYDTPSRTLESISAVFTQGSAVIYDTVPLDSLKQYLVVTANYSDSTTETVTNYTLSGTLTVGTSTITVTYGGKTTTFTVNVTATPTITGIEATYTQGQTVVYTDTSLNSLKSNLVVKAIFSDNTKYQLDDSAYTLSGTLTVGTSIVTVTYESFTTTFEVTVTQAITYHSVTNSLTGCITSNSSSQVADGDVYNATITASTGYTLTGATVSIVMGETDITSTAYTNGTISIAFVNGNITITIVAEVDIQPSVWYDLTPSMFTATRSDVTINASGFIHQENIIQTDPETKYPEIILDNRITALDFDIDNTGAYTWLIMAGTKDNYGAIALTQSSGGYPAQMLNGQTGKTSGLGGTKLNGCPYGNGHYTVTKDSSGITISKTGGASVTYTTANQPIYDYGDSSSWILGFCIQPNSPTGNGYKNIKVMFGGEVTE